MNGHDPVHAHDAAHAAGHIVPLRVYFTIFFTLLVLTAVTIWVSAINLGPLNTVVAMTIACTKALLVILYFMHVRYGSRLVWVFLGIAVLWLGILIAITMADYGSRGWLPFPGK